MKPFEKRLSVALGETLPGEPYLAAVSGGADSTAMLAALAELRREAGFSLFCVHVEHGIRPDDESRGDAEAVAALCEKLDAPYRIVSIPRGKIASFAASGGPGVEAAARHFRYRALYREARRVGARRLLTAHTRDDLLETLLMRLLRGSGPAGLSPMPRSRGLLLRPLLDATRPEILQYLEERGLPYRTDSTNADIAYLRNRVRLKLVPLLDAFFPSWRQSLLALAETQALAAEFLAAEAGKRLPWEVEEGLKPGEARALRLREDVFLNAPPILREEALFAAIDALAAAGGAGRRLLKIPALPRRAGVRRAAADAGRKSAALPGDLGPVRLERRGGFIELAPARRNPGERGFSLLIKEAGFYTLKGKVSGGGAGGDLRIRAGISPGGESPPPGAAVFRAGFPLVLRSPRAGDRVFRSGHARGLSDILDKEASAERAGIVVACDPEGIAAFVRVGRNGALTALPREGPRQPERNGAAGNSGFFLFEISLDARVL